MNSSFSLSRYLIIPFSSFGPQLTTGSTLEIKIIKESGDYCNVELSEQEAISLRLSLYFEFLHSKWQSNLLCKKTEA
jgi:hypothetical protein